MFLSSCDLLDYNLCTKSSFISFLIWFVFYFILFYFVNSKPVFFSALKKIVYCFHFMSNCIIYLAYPKWRKRKKSNSNQLVNMLFVRYISLPFSYAPVLKKMFRPYCLSAAFILRQAPVSYLFVYFLFCFWFFSLYFIVLYILFLYIYIAV